VQPEVGGRRLIKSRDITLHVRFKGGALRTLHRPLPPTAWQMRQTSAAAVAEIDRLLNDHTEAQIAILLNERGFRPGADQDFTAVIVGNIRRGYGLKTRYDRLRERGLLTLDEMAARLGVCTQTVKRWRYAGLLRARAYNDKNAYLYEPPGPDPPRKDQGRRLATRRRPVELVPSLLQEVQCEA